jgi:uncharacterized membrane protein YagU involved in acid resistance
MPQAQAGVSLGPMVHWRAAVSAGVLAGAVFIMFEMVMVALFLTESPWAPPRMMAAIVLGETVLPPPATFDFGVMTVAMTVHFVLSILYAFIIAEIIQYRGTGLALSLGAAAGLVIYLVNFYGFTAVFPWFAMARNWVSVVGHILFGVVTAWAYLGFVKRE